MREMVLPQMQRHGPIEAWIIDDTSFPSRGDTRSVLRGNTAASSAGNNCQVAVSLSIATGDASLPVAYRLDLPQEVRRMATGCARRAFRRTLASRPSMRSRSSSSSGRARPGCRAAWW